MNDESMLRSSFILHRLDGGEGGIRTHGTVSRTQHFQCCQFSHSCTSPHQHAVAKRKAGIEVAMSLPRCFLRAAYRLLAVLAERVGFEPTVPVRAQRFSRPPDSTTLAPLRTLVISPFTKKRL